MSGLLWPREHGAWAMLLLPFFAALAVARGVRWESLAALVAILGIFLAQEPLLVLLRQRYVWKERRAAADQAVSSFLLTAVPAALAGCVLLWRLPWKPLAALGVVASVLLLLRIVFTISRKQRFALLQVLEATGLSATALLGYLSARGALDLQALLVWAAFSLHHAAALFVIRARLEAIVSTRSQTGMERRFRVAAWAGQVALLVAIVGSAAAGSASLALAFAIPFALHTRDLFLLDNPIFLKTPLTRVGWREVAISLAFFAVVVASFRV